MFHATCAGSTHLPRGIDILCHLMVIAAVVRHACDEREERLEGLARQLADYQCQRAGQERTVHPRHWGKMDEDHKSSRGSSSSSSPSSVRSLPFVSGQRGGPGRSRGRRAEAPSSRMSGSHETRRPDVCPQMSLQVTCMQTSIRGGRVKAIGYQRPRQTRQEDDAATTEGEKGTRSLG